VTAAVEDAIAAISAAAGRRRQTMTDDEVLFTQVDALEAHQMINLMDSDLEMISNTNNFGPVEMQDLNNMQDHIGGTAAALNLNADDLADLINNISDKVQNAIAQVLDQLANLQDILANIADAVGAANLDVGALEVIATANMEDMAATGELTTAELVDIGNIQDALNGALGDISLDALAGLTPDALADLANLDLANIQDALNLPDVADLEDLIANIKDQVPDVAAALDELANLKDAVANLDLGLDVANLQAVNLADLAAQANLDVLTDLEIADLSALQDVLDQVAANVNLPDLPDGLNIVNLEEIAALAGAQLDMVTAQLNLPNVDAAAIQNVLDEIANINFNIADIQDVLAQLQGNNGVVAADLTYLQTVDIAPLEIHMEPQMAAMVTAQQTILDSLWNKGLDIDVLPDGINDDDLARLDAMSQSSLNQVITGLQSNPDIYQLRTLMTAAEEQPVSPPATNPGTQPTRPQNGGNNGGRNQNKGGATQPRPNTNTNRPRDTTQSQQPTDQSGQNTGMTGMNGGSSDNSGMTGMSGNTGMNGGMNNGMNGMNGMDGSMDGHDHAHEEPPIYSNPMVLGAGVVILLGLAFLVYKKMSSKPKDEGLLASEVQRSNIPTYAQQPMTV